MADLTVITYGGGEILQHIFDATAHLMGKGQNGIIWPLSMIIASIGGIWAISKAFFSSSVDALITHYILPVIAIPSLLMVPTASIKIEDVVRDISYKVDHVPLFLARIAELTSTIGYELTKGVETIMHIPSDVSYHKTGMLFAAETSLDISKFKVTNATLEQNLSKFAKQCIVYDMALGLYSMDELRKSTDLMSFLKENTSKVRMIHYFDPSDSSGKKNGEYLTCQGTLEKFTQLFDTEKAYFSQLELLKHLPLTFQALTGMQKDGEKLISQQIMISNLSTGLASSNLAKMRAEAQQKNTYRVLGLTAPSGLIYIRVGLESLIYSSFFIIIPLALIPGGIKFIFYWLWLCVWIQLWPPFFAILNYIMQIEARNYAKTVMFGLSENDVGLSLFTSEGLQNLHGSIADTTGYLCISIPFISYAIMQGAQSFVHLVGTLAAPAQSAATGSATEQTSGNYSFANTNVGQMSYQNTSALQSNTAPSISSGFTSEHHGSYSAVHAHDGTSRINQHSSVLTSSLFSDEAISESLQNNHQIAKTHTASTQQNYSESISKSARAMEDFTNHFGSSTSYSESLSERDGNSIQESCGYVKNAVESFAKQHGISTSEGYDIISAAGASGSAGFRLFGNGVSSNFSTSNNFSDVVSSSDVLSAAASVTASEDFQKHFNNVTEYARNNAHSSLNDEGTKLASGLTESLDNVRSSQESYQNALNEMNQASQNLSWSESNSHQIKRSLNQEFVEWSKEKIGLPKTVEMLESRSSTEREQMMGEFLNDYFAQVHRSNYTLEGYKDPHQAFKTSSVSNLDYGKEQASMKASFNAVADAYGFSQNANDGRRETMEIRSDTLSAHSIQRLDSNKASHTSAKNNMQSDFESKKNESRLSRMYSEIMTEDTVGSKYKSGGSPLWLQD